MKNNIGLLIEKLCSFKSNNFFRFRRRSYTRKHGEQISLVQIYEHTCGHCGKRIQDHNFGKSGTVQTWDIMKRYYDLDTCIIPKGYYVQSFPNGFGMQNDYYLYSITTNKCMTRKDFIYRKNWIVN